MGKIYWNRIDSENIEARTMGAAGQPTSKIVVSRLASTHFRINLKLESCEWREHGEYFLSQADAVTEAAHMFDLVKW